MFRTLTGLIVLLGALAMADTLTLRDGTTIQGSYVGGDSRHVRMLVGSDVQTFELSRVKSLEFGDATASASPAAALAATANDESGPPRMRRRHVDEATSDAPAAATASSAPAAQPAPAASGGFVPASGAAQGQVTQAAAPASPAGGSAQQAVSIPTGTELAIRLDDAVDSQKDKVGQTTKPPSIKM